MRKAIYDMNQQSLQDYYEDFNNPQPIQQQLLPQQPSVVYYYPNGSIGVAQNNSFKYYPDCLYIESKGFKMSIPSNAIDDKLKITLGVTAGATLGVGLLIMLCKALGNSNNINLNNLMR